MSNLFGLSGIDKLKKLDYYCQTRETLFLISSGNEMSDFDTELNCEGLNCPLPVLKTKKEIDGMSSGEILKMTSTDPGSVNDVTFWSKTNGNYLLSHTEDGGVYTFFIQKK